MPDKRANIPPRAPLTLVRELPATRTEEESPDRPTSPRPTLAALLREGQALRSEAARLAAIPRTALSMRERRENAARLHAITEQIRANAAAIRAIRGEPEERVEPARKRMPGVRWFRRLLIGLLLLLAGIVLLALIGPGIRAILV